MPQTPFLEKFALFCGSIPSESTGAIAEYIAYVYELAVVLLAVVDSK